LPVTFTHPAAAAHHRARETIELLQRLTPTLYLQTCGFLRVPTIILWLTGYGEYCMSVFIDILLRMWMSWNCVWLKLGQVGYP